MKKLRDWKIREVQYLAMVIETATRHKVDPALVLAIIRQESDFRAPATNKTGGDLARGGAYGLMQMTLKTAIGLGFKGEPEALLDPQTNLNYGCLLLSQLGKRKGYNVADVMAAYNSGKPKSKAPPSTLVYVARAGGFYAEYTELLREYRLAGLVVS